MKKTGKTVAEAPPQKFMTEVARLRDLQRGFEEVGEAFWLSEIAVQLARLTAQLRYNADKSPDFYA